MIDLTLGIAFFAGEGWSSVKLNKIHVADSIPRFILQDNCTVLLFTHVDTTVELALQLLLSS